MLKKSLIGICLLANAVNAELIPLITPAKNPAMSVIADAIENAQSKYRDRIYYYDLAVDDSGKAYVLYASPIPKASNSNAPVSNDEVSEIWLLIETEQGWVKQPITNKGAYQPTGLRLQLDKNGVLHLCYIEKQSVVLGTETKIEDYLMYRTFENGALTAEKMVGDVPKGNVAGLGGWRTYMAIAPDNEVYFLRESEIDGTPKQPLLKLLVPDGKGNWEAKNVNFTNLPAPNWFHLGKFLIDSTGEAHIIFGDFKYNKQGQLYDELTQPSADRSHNYHNLWYASSKTLDGEGWSAFKLDEDPANTIPTLYEQEFWIDLILDEQNNPIVTTWLHPVGTNENKYNTKSFMFSRDLTGNWSGNTITRTFDGLAYKGKGYVEGMGAGLIKNGSGWHGVWDNSHSRPFEHESPNGGLIYRFSSDGKNWSYYQLLAEFSGEGHSIAKIDKQNRLNVLVLGDYKDTKLYFLRYQMPASNLMEVFSDRKFYYNGESIALNARVETGAVGDFYVALIGEARPEIQQSQEIWQLKGDFSWEKLDSLTQLKPILTLGQGISFNGKIAEIGAKQSPFKNPDTNYTLYSAVSKSGTNVLQPQNWVTPLFVKQLIANKTLPLQ